MLQKIWQIIGGMVSRRRNGLDNANIEHLRADLRFRLAMVEYAYFGKSGRRVARRLAELKSLLGDKATHRYLRALDPDLRGQFVERIQGARRDLVSAAGHRPTKQAPGEAPVKFDLEAFAPNVVSIKSASRKVAGPAGAPTARNGPQSKHDNLPADSGEK